METEIVVALIQTAGSLLVPVIGALIGWWLSHKSKEEQTETIIGEGNPKMWKWIIVGAILGVFLSQGIWLFRDSIGDLFKIKSEYSERSIRISAADDWQASGIYLAKGDSLEVFASEEKWRNGYDWTTADGTGTNSYFSDIGISTSKGSLIGKIGDSSPFAIGATKKLTADDTGVLYFRIHDATLDDNSGAVTIRIKVWR